MSIAKTFPEIESFFRQREFSDHDLCILIRQLEQKYSGIELSKAKQAFDLKLLGYNLQKNEGEDLHNSKITLSNNSKNSSLNALKDEKRRKREQKKAAIHQIKKAINEGTPLTEYNRLGYDVKLRKRKPKTDYNAIEELEEIRKEIESAEFTVRRLSKELNLSVPKLQKMISKRGGGVGAMILTEKEYSAYLRKFKAVLRTKNGKMDKIERRPKSSGVWDRIAEHGPSKLIYNRSSY